MKNFNYKVGSTIRRIKKPVDICPIGYITKIEKLEENSNKLWYKDIHNHMVFTPLSDHNFEVVNENFNPIVESEFVSIDKYLENGVHIVGLTSDGRINLVFKKDLYDLNEIQSVIDTLEDIKKIMTPSEKTP